MEEAEVEEEEVDDDVLVVVVLAWEEVVVEEDWVIEVEDCEVVVVDGRLLLNTLMPPRDGSELVVTLICAWEVKTSTCVWVPLEMLMTKYEHMCMHLHKSKQANKHTHTHTQNGIEISRWRDDCEIDNIIESAKV